MKGLAHIGILEAIEDAGIPVVGIVGTSMGSIMGGLYACGYKPAEIAAIIQEADLAKLLGDKQATLLPKGEEGAKGRNLW